MSGKEAEDIEVTRQDQDMINSYGKLNNKLQEFKRSKLAKEREKEALKDVENEMMLSEDDFILYKFGECFMKLTKEEAEQRLSDSASALDTELDGISQQMEKIQGKMTELKVVLKSKFKNSINLDPMEE